VSDLRKTFAEFQSELAARNLKPLNITTNAPNKGNRRDTREGGNAPTGPSSPAFNVHAMCLCFEPQPNQADPELDSLKVLPDQMHDKQHIAFYLTNELTYLIYDIIMQFEKNVRELIARREKEEASPATSLSTILGNLSGTPGPGVKDEFTLITPLDRDAPQEDSKTSKKRRIGRLIKQLGDYALLAGSPTDAILLYVHQG